MAERKRFDVVGAPTALAVIVVAALVVFSCVRAIATNTPRSSTSESALAGETGAVVSSLGNRYLYSPIIADAQPPQRLSLNNASAFAYEECRSGGMQTFDGEAVTNLNTSIRWSDGYAALGYPEYRYLRCRGDLIRRFRRTTNLTPALFLWLEGYDSPYAKCEFEVASKRPSADIFRGIVIKRNGVEAEDVTLLSDKACSVCTFRIVMPCVAEKVMETRWVR